jgi:mono/diheme cytochrome c family protein
MRKAVHSGVSLFAAALALATVQSAAAEPFLSRGWRFDERGGEALYQHICSACHQADGKGAVGAAAYPALMGNRNLASAEYVESILFNGLRGMPALGRMMSDEQVADVVNYVRSRFGAITAGGVTAEDIKAARPK